jgi:hypothetical protein
MDGCWPSGRICEGPAMIDELFVSQLSCKKPRDGWGSGRVVLFTLI